MKRKLILIALTLIIAVASVFGVFAEAPSYSAKIRVDGKGGNLFYDELTTNNELNFNIINMILIADAQSENMVIKGLDKGYITEINGDKIGSAKSGQDIYVIRVNGKYVPYSEIDEYKLESGDEILVYYSDEFGDGIIFPMVDMSKLTSERQLRFLYEKPSEDGKSFSNEALEGAKVSWYCDDIKFTYTADANGSVIIDKSAFTVGVHKLELELLREDGVSAILRLSPDFTVEVPEDVGDSNAVYIASATALISLCGIVCLAISLKKKKI